MRVAGPQLTPSSTADSLGEAAVKGYTPSMTSSGYGSQAVSTLTLSSDDSISLKSMEEISEGAARSGSGSGAGQATSTGLKRASTGASTDSDADDANGASGASSANRSIEEEKPESKDAPGDEEGAGGGEGKAQEEEEGRVEGEGGEEEAATTAAPADHQHDDGTFDALGCATVAGSGDQDPEVSGRGRSDSLLDEQVPDIKDSPLKPVPSPSPHLVKGGQFFPAQEGGSSGPGPTEGAAVVDVDSDPYSVTAMEELERLGEEEEEGDVSTAMDDSVSSFKSPPPPTHPSSNTSEPEHSHSNSSKAALEASTPPKDTLADRKVGGSGWKGGSGKKRGSGMRPRPMSMVVSPQAEVMTRAWQDDITRRSSLHLSEDSLAGTWR